jgi:hypothetical protein
MVVLKVKYNKGRLENENGQVLTPDELKLAIEKSSSVEFNVAIFFDSEFSEFVGRVYYNDKVISIVRFSTLEGFSQRLIQHLKELGASYGIAK